MQAESLTTLEKGHREGAAINSWAEGFTGDPGHPVDDLQNQIRLGAQSIGQQQGAAWSEVHGAALSGRRWSEGGKRGSARGKRRQRRAGHKRRPGRGELEAINRCGSGRRHREQRESQGTERRLLRSVRNVAQTGPCCGRFSISRQAGEPDTPRPWIKPMTETQASGAGACEDQQAKKAATNQDRPSGIETNAPHPQQLKIKQFLEKTKPKCDTQPKNPNAQ